jgi:O-antigen ligase
MSTGTMEYFLEDTLSNNLFGRGHNSFIVSGNEIIKSGSFDKNTVSYGPHNSYLFIILNYGVVGLILYLLIFKNIIVYTFKLKTVFNLSPHFYVVAAFFVLSFSSDLLQNHSISWYLYLSSFLLMREIQNDGSLEV